MDDAHRERSAGHIGIEKTYYRVVHEYHRTTRSENHVYYLLFIQDLFIRCIASKLLRSADGKSVGEALKELVSFRWKPPCSQIVEEYDEPFTVLELLSPTVYRAEAGLDRKVAKLNVENLKRCVSPTQARRHKQCRGGEFVILFSTFVCFIFTFLLFWLCSSY